MEGIHRPFFIIGTFYIRIWTFQLWVRESFQLDNDFLNRSAISFKWCSLQSSEQVPVSVEVVSSPYVSPQIRWKRCLVTVTHLMTKPYVTTSGYWQVLSGQENNMTAETGVEFLLQKENQRLSHQLIWVVWDTSLALVAGLQKRFLRLLLSKFIYTN